jgi:hypothetical protein
MDIKLIPDDELIADRQASLEDIVACEAALKIGYMQHRDGSSVQDRLESNRRIVTMIDAEIQRRLAEAMEDEWNELDRIGRP